MQGLTWKALGAPEYLMTFLEGFLLLFIPSIAGGTAIDTGGVIDLKAWPASQTMFIAVLFGTLNGIRSLRNLRAPAPEPRPEPAKP